MEKKKKGNFYISSPILDFKICTYWERSDLKCLDADNLAANFSRELADYIIYIIDVSGGDKIPRKGGPGITQADLLVRASVLISAVVLLPPIAFSQLSHDKDITKKPDVNELSCLIIGNKQDWPCTSSWSWFDCDGARCATDAWWRTICFCSGVLNSILFFSQILIVRNFIVALFFVH